MKLIFAVAVLFLTSCTSVQTQDIAREMPAAREDQKLTEIKRRRTIAVSAGVDTKGMATDGDLDTWWSAFDFAPQWLEVSLDYWLPVGRIVLIPSQASPGPATHRVRAERGGEVVVWHRFDTDLSADGQPFVLKIDPPQRIDKVRILTTQHEGWVAWREVQLFANPLLSESLAGLKLPVQLTHAGDGSGRLFVLEQEGRIRIVRDGALVETPFLDITQRVSLDSLEQGLLNVAFPPSYVNNQRFYVSYTDTNGDTVISRFATGADADQADPDSEEIILTIEQPGDIHNGGTLKFGPRDGYLYIGSGDGKITELHLETQHTQDAGSLLGKILRIDVESGVKPYAIPPDNPFVLLPGSAPEIWATGLRNPWGFAFDQQTGDLYIPDSSGEASEEVNFQPADSPGGENYGWPVWEGEDLTGAAGEVENAVMPVTVYARSQGCAIVGGVVYEGQFIYGDFCTGRIWSLRRLGHDKWESKLLMGPEVPISSIGADEAGNLYALGYVGGIVFPLSISTYSE